MKIYRNFANPTSHLFLRHFTIVGLYYKTSIIQHTAPFSRRLLNYCRPYTNLTHHMLSEGCTGLSRHHYKYIYICTYLRIMSVSSSYNHIASHQGMLSIHAIIMNTNSDAFTPTWVNTYVHVVCKETVYVFSVLFKYQ